MFFLRTPGVLLSGSVYPLVNDRTRYSAEISVLTVVLYLVLGSPWQLDLESGCCSIKIFNKIFLKDAWPDRLYIQNSD